MTRIYAMLGLMRNKMIMNLNRTNLEKLMEIAIDEAKVSLLEGNSGFGAVIEKDGRIIVQTHDTDSTDGDPTAHAEFKAIKAASAKLWGNLGTSIGLLVE